MKRLLFSTCFSAGRCRSRRRTRRSFDTCVSSCCWRLQSGYVNARADSLMDTLAVTLDRDAARPLWREYQRLMVREVPVAVLLYPHSVLALRSRLQGVEGDAVRHPFLSAPRWWIAPAVRRAGESRASR